MNNDSKNSSLKKIVILIIACAALALLVFTALKKFNLIGGAGAPAYVDAADRDMLYFDKLSAEGKLTAGRRIIFITGDSVTMGRELKTFQLAYPFRIENMLRRHSAGSGPTVVAEETENTEQAALKVEEIAGRCRAAGNSIQFAVVGLCLDDAAPAQTLESSAADKPATALKTIPFKQLEQNLKALYAAPPEPIRKGFAAIPRTASSNRFSVMVVVFPAMVDMDNYPFSDIHATVTELASTRGYYVIDMLESYRGLPLEAIAAAPNRDAFHPSALGHKIAADAVFFSAANRRWFPGYSPDRIRNETAAIGAAEAAAFCPGITGEQDDKKNAACVAALETLASAGRVLKWAATSAPGEFDILIAPPRPQK